MVIHSLDFPPFPVPVLEYVKKGEFQISGRRLDWSNRERTAIL